MKFPGYGLIQGLNVTFKNFVASYFRKADHGGIFTVEYPEKRLPSIEAFRNFPFLVYDDTPANLRCTACEICANECPPKCIFIVKAKDEAGKPLKSPAVFDIDFGLCMNCGLCEEVCPFDSIYMDHNFEIAVQGRQETMVSGKEALAKPNEYFHKVRPTDAARVDAKRAAKKPKGPS